MTPQAGTYLHQQVQNAFALCADKADLKIIIAPSRNAATALRTSMAQLGTPSINVEALTPSSLSKHIWMAQKPEESHRYVSRQAVSFLLGHFLSSFDSDAARLLLRSLRTVTQSIFADKENLVGLEELRLSAKTDVQTTYVEVLDEYQSFLKENGRMDDVDVTRAAIRLVPSFVEQRHVASVLLSDLTAPSALELELIEQLGSKVPHALLIGSNSEPNPLMPDWDYVKVLEGLSGAPIPPVLVAPTRREEVRRVLANLIDGDVPFDQVEIAYTNPSFYEPEIVAACERFDIPWQLSTRSRWDQSLQQFLRLYASWVESGFEARVLLNMLRSQLIDTEQFGCSPEEISQVLTAFPLRFTRFSQPNVIEAMYAKAYDRGISKDLIGKFEQLVGAISPFELGAQCTVQQFGKAFVGLVGAIGHSRIPKDQVQDFWLDTVQIAKYGYLPKSSTRHIAKHIAELKSNAALVRQAGLRLVPIADAGYGLSQRLYVLGLDDLAAKSAENGSELSHSMVENHSSGSLSNSSSDPGGAWTLSTRNLVKELCFRYPKSIVLCTPSYDVESGRPLFPSAAWLEVTHQSELVAQPRSQSLDFLEFLSHQKDSNDCVSLPNLAFARWAESKKESPEWTAYDGMVDDSSIHPLVDVSPSKLEVLSACPYKFFLSDLLGIHPIPKREDKWLTSREEGSLVHSLFERHTKARLDSENTEPISLEAQEATLNVFLEQALAQSALLIEGDTGAFVGRKTKEIGLSISLFLKKETEQQRFRTPVGVEYSFGKGDKVDEPPCVVELSTGSLALTGRLDRLDRLENGEYVITDYKTGKFDGYAPKELKKLSEHLQWAIYSLMVAHQLKVQVQRFEYFFPSTAGLGLVRGLAPPAPSDVIGLLETLTKRYLSGAFIQAASSDACRYCDFRPICGDLDQRKEELTHKFERMDNRIEQAYGEWPYRVKAGKK